MRQLGIESWMVCMPRAGPERSPPGLPETVRRMDALLAAGKVSTIELLFPVGGRFSATSEQ